MSGFNVATWNVYNSTPARTLSPVLKNLHQTGGVSLFLFQEMQQAEVRKMVREHGLKLYFCPPQYVIAWDPQVWVEIGSRCVRLSDTPYVRTGGATAYVDAAMSVLRHRRSGNRLTTMSYHLPAAVQRADPPASRWKALTESAVSWRRLQAHANTKAVLFGGDDNVDERLGYGPWGFMLRKATGLRQVQSPTGTHGNRKIDDFRIKGLVVGAGRSVPVPAPDDHDVHVRRFSWK